MESKINRTKIEWTDYTWNPITGCKNNCTYCYAHTLADGRLKSLYLGNGNCIGNPDNPFSPRFWMERLREPSSIKRPSRIFVCSMGEMFGDWVPVNWRYRIWEVIKNNPQHTFQILTKFPENIFFDFGRINNCWMGVSITTQKVIHKLDKLYENTFVMRFSLCPVRFASFEPLLSEIEASFRGLDWIIIGGCSSSKPFYPPEEWIQKIEKEAAKFNISLFEKDNLKKVWKRPPRREFPVLKGKLC